MKANRVHVGIVLTELSNSFIDEELMEEVTDFPHGEHDDLVDSTTLA